MALWKWVVRVTIAFAVFGYFICIGLFFAPLSWRLPPIVVYAICPPALLTITVDLSFRTVALMLAPMNALVYGTAGGVVTVIALGILVEFRSRR